MERLVKKKKKHFFRSVRDIEQQLEQDDDCSTPLPSPLRKRKKRDGVDEVKESRSPDQPRLSEEVSISRQKRRGADVEESLTTEDPNRQQSVAVERNIGDSVGRELGRRRLLRDHRPQTDMAEHLGNSKSSDETEQIRTTETDVDAPSNEGLMGCSEDDSKSSKPSSSRRRNMESLRSVISSRPSSRRSAKREPVDCSEEVEAKTSLTKKNNEKAVVARQDHDAQSAKSTGHLFLSDCYLLLVEGGTDLTSRRAALLQEKITAKGGKLLSLDPNHISKKVTHLIVSDCFISHHTHSDSHPNKLPFTFQMLQKREKHLKIATSRWITECLKKNAKVEDQSFFLDIFCLFPEERPPLPPDDADSERDSPTPHWITPFPQEPSIAFRSSSLPSSAQLSIDQLTGPSTYPPAASSSSSFFSTPAAFSTLGGSLPSSSNPPADNESCALDQISSQVEFDDNVHLPPSTTLPSKAWVDKGKQHLACQQMSGAVVNHNSHITSVLEKLEGINKSVGDQWRTYAYRKAAGIVKKLPFRIETAADVKHIEKIPGLGGKMIKKIVEIINTGQLRKLKMMENDERVKAVGEFSKIHGVGGSTALKWYSKGLRTLADVKRQVEARALVLSQTQSIGMQFAEDKQKRIPRAEVAQITDHVRRVAESLVSDINVVCCGSYRRGKPDSGDVDLLMTAPSFDMTLSSQMVRHRLMKNLIHQLHQPIVVEGPFLDYSVKQAKDQTDSAATSNGPAECAPSSLLHSGPSVKCEGDGSNKHQLPPFLTGELTSYTRPSRDHGTQTWMGFCMLPKNSSQYSGINRRLDMKIYSSNSFPFALLYFTGSDHFNRSMRFYAKKKGWTLSDHGLAPAVRANGDKVWTGKSILCRTEKDIFAAMGLDYIPPDQRNCYETFGMTEEEVKTMKEEENTEKALEKIVEREAQQLKLTQKLEAIDSMQPSIKLAPSGDPSFSSAVNQESLECVTPVDDEEQIMTQLKELEDEETKQKSAREQKKVMLEEVDDRVEKRQWALKRRKERLNGVVPPSATRSTRGKPSGSPSRFRSAKTEHSEKRSISSDQDTDDEREVRQRRQSKILQLGKLKSVEQVKATQSSQS